MNRPAYKKQGSYCVSLIRQNKKQYYDSLNVNHIKVNKNFWRVVKPNFSNKIFGSNRVILRDGGKFICDTKKVADIYKVAVIFVNVGNTFLKAIKKYSTHHSVLSIKEKMNNNVFYFRKVTYEEILNETNSLDTSKSAQSEDNLFKIIKDDADIFANFILQSFKKCIIDVTFTVHLKKADVRPIHNDKTNYRQVSICPSFRQIYERLIYKQIN